RAECGPGEQDAQGDGANDVQAAVCDGGDCACAGIAGDFYCLAQAVLVLSYCYLYIGGCAMT
ncbi:hypothetical protein PIIN_10941, partial [Serendipita indica DSM 11827]